MRIVMPQNTKIPPERRALYYGGMAVGAVGLVLFASTFVFFLANFGNFDNFAGRARLGGFLAFGGIFLVIVGGALMSVGARGLAGSGVLLDPTKARRDLEPWARMGGGMLGDALEESGLPKKPGAPEVKVKVRCSGCRGLNPEAARFCNQCGAALD